MNDEMLNNTKLNQFIESNKLPPEDETGYFDTTVLAFRENINRSKKNNFKFAYAGAVLSAVTVFAFIITYFSFGDFNQPHTIEALSNTLTTEELSENVSSVEIETIVKDEVVIEDEEDAEVIDEMLAEDISPDEINTQFDDVINYEYDVSTADAGELETVYNEIKNRDFTTR